MISEKHLETICVVMDIIQINIELKLTFNFNIVFKNNLCVILSLCL